MGRKIGKGVFAALKPGLVHGSCARVRRRCSILQTEDEKIRAAYLEAVDKAQKQGLLHAGPRLCSCMARCPRTAEVRCSGGCGRRDYVEGAGPGSLAPQGCDWLPSTRLSIVISLFIRRGAVCGVQRRGNQVMGIHNENIWPWMLLGLGKDGNFISSVRLEPDQVDCRPAPSLDSICKTYGHESSYFSTCGICLNEQIHSQGQLSDPTGSIAMPLRASDAAAASIKNE
jgi:hypothetical protein